MIADTLYAKYINEREGAHIVETPSGFCTYKIKNQECFIIDLFVAQEARKSGEARRLIELLNSIAHESDCNVITANILLADPGANTTLAASLAIGLSVKRANADVLLITLPIKED